jgi:hypothetical protein
VSSGHGEYRIIDARGVSIGDNNTIYQYFQGERYAPLAHKLISFTDLIAEKTDGFVGRRFAADAIDRFVGAHRSGYFVIEGEPGVGKTSLLAHLVATRGYPHHFVVAALGVNRADQFLDNVCAQLIAAYRLDRPSWLPPEASRDGAFLGGLLAQISRESITGPVCVVVVDALDEVSATGDVRENVLYLPPNLPDRVFFVVATRPRDRADLRLQVNSREFFQLDSRSAANLADVCAYLEGFTGRPTMRGRLTDLRLSVEAFVDTLLDKAEGNFMYLHYVLPAIEQGRLGGTGLGDLPQGLQAYYESHWRQMRRAAAGEWFAYWQPVIVHLAAAREPVSVHQLALWTGLPAPRVGDVLRGWREFVHVETLNTERRYRIYHASFQDFLQAKDEAREIDLKDTHSRIADNLIETMLREGDP